MALSDHPTDSKSHQPGGVQTNLLAYIIIIIIIVIIIIITRPWPAFGRQGLDGWSGRYNFNW